MITEIDIKNYQSLEDVHIDLGQSLTVVLGDNDLGKSALVRAIQAAAEAQSGTDFITHGKTVAKVRLVVDGHILVWEKGQTVNRFTLDGVVYDRVGRQVPPDVRDFLSLHPVDYDRDLQLNINFAQQDEPAFLIPMPGGMTPTHVAKVLGDLTNLNLLFKAVTECDRRRKSAGSLLATRRGDLEQVDREIASLPDIAAERAEVSALHSLLVNARHLAARKQSLERLLGELSSVNREWAALSEQEAALPDQDELDRLYEQLREQYGKLANYRNILNTLHALNVEAQSLTEEEKRADEMIEEAEEELRSTLESLDVCPTCDRPMRELEHAH